MRIAVLLATFAFAAPAVAQNWHVPDSVTTTGYGNVIPFGSPALSYFSNCKFQTRCTAADLGSLPNLVTGLGFLACMNGWVYFDRIQIVLDHIPNAQPLATTFASNLTTTAVTVLDISNYTWHVAGNAWNEIGLQDHFIYNGIDDLLVQITVTNGSTPVNFRTGDRQRLFWNGAIGSPGATGMLSSGACKIEVSMSMARTSSHGNGCQGSNGVPRLAFTGSPQVGSTFSFDLQNGVPNGIAMFIAGTTNGAPYPVTLGTLGAPACSVYANIAGSAAILTSATGAGSFAMAIPPSLVGFRFYGQYAVFDPAANAFGFTTSNYLHVHTGN